jgi:hypothetical protein
MPLGLVPSHTSLTLSHSLLLVNTYFDGRYEKVQLNDPFVALVKFGKFQKVQDLLKINTKFSWKKLRIYC